MPAPHRRSRATGSGILWPGADPTSGRSLFLDQLGLWDAIVLPSPRGDGAPRFRPAGCEVRRIAARGSKQAIGDFLGRIHYTAGPGMRGLPFGLYRGESLLGVAVFSRACRPRWAAERFALLPVDRTRSPLQRRHLTVTEAEYAFLSRFALSPLDTDDAPLGTGAASWFLCRCLAGIEARNRTLWTAQQRFLRGEHLGQMHLQVLREAAGADDGRGRGYLKGVATWADPYQGTLGRIYQILNFHYSGRSNNGRWTREAVGLRSDRRLSARTLAKARSPSQAGHASAAMRLAWEGGDVQIEVRSGGSVVSHDAGWVAAARVVSGAAEPEIGAALDAAWSSWRRAHVAPGAVVSLRWRAGMGIQIRRFPPKHSYFSGLGSSPWYRRQIEIRHRPLTDRLLAEQADRHTRRAYYPTTIPPAELRPDVSTRIHDH